MLHLIASPNVHADLVRNLLKFLVPVPADFNEASQAAEFTNSDTLNDPFNYTVSAQVAIALRLGQLVHDSNDIY